MTLVTFGAIADLIVAILGTGVREVKFKASLFLASLDRLVALCVV